MKEGRTATIGMFDGVHLGHRHILDTLRKSNNSSCPPLVITFNNHPLSIINPEKQPHLLSTPEEKAHLLTLQDTQPLLLDFDEKIRTLTASEFLDLIHKEYGVDKLVIGFNNHFGCDAKSLKENYVELGKKAGVEIDYATEYLFDESVKVNSSAIRKLLADGNVREAKSLLGYNYSITGRVIKGNQIGRTIGFPTANISPLYKDKLIPKSGVYKGVAIIDGKSFFSLINIGKRPTVTNDNNITIEAFVDNFNGDLYNKIIKTEFIEFIRDERKFDDINQLKHQIEDDLSKIRLT